MADNKTFQSATPATLPAGTVVATDEVGGADYQMMKLVDGTDGSVERIQGTAANGLEVDVTRVQGTVAVSGTFYQATQPVSGPLTDAELRATPVPVSGTFWQATQPVSIAATVTVDSELTTADLDTGGGTDTRAVVGLVVAKSGGAANVSSSDPLPVAVISGGGGGTQYAEDTAHASGDTGTMALGVRKDTAAALAGADGDYQPMIFDSTGKLHVNVGNTPTVTPTPATSGGLTIYRVLSAASTNAANIKGSAGQVFGWVITNVASSPRFVKLYNKATSPTVGTDTPVMTLLIPGNTSGSGMVAAEFSHGIAFSSGISIAITGLVADADTTAISANDVIINLFYK